VPRGRGDEPAFRRTTGPHLAASRTGSARTSWCADCHAAGSAGLAPERPDHAGCRASGTTGTRRSPGRRTATAGRTCATTREERRAADKHAGRRVHLERDGDDHGLRRVPRDDRTSLIHRTTGRTCRRRSTGSVRTSCARTATRRGARRAPERPDHAGGRGVGVTTGTRRSRDDVRRLRDERVPQRREERRAADKHAGRRVRLERDGDDHGTATSARVTTRGP